MKINKLISIVILFIIILILIFLFVLPKYNSLTAVQIALAQKEAEYNSKSVYYAKIAEITKSIEGKKDALEKIDSALPSDFYLSSLIYFFQQKGLQAPLAVRSVALSQISAAVTEGSVRDITFNIRMGGTYAGLKAFLSSLDASARLFEVNSISFSAPALPQGGSLPASQQMYEFNLEVVTHIY